MAVTIAGPLSIADFLLLPLISSRLGWHPKLGLCRNEKRAYVDEQTCTVREVEASFPMPKPERRPAGNDNQQDEGA